MKDENKIHGFPVADASAEEFSEPFAAGGLCQLALFTAPTATGTGTFTVQVDAGDDNWVDTALTGTSGATATYTALAAKQPAARYRIKHAAGGTGADSKATLVAVQG